MEFEEARRLLALAEGQRLAPLVVLALMTGRRRAELLGLRWSDVDLDRGDLRVEQTLYGWTAGWSSPGARTLRRGLDPTLLGGQGPMTNPTSHEQNDGPRWWLELDDGELLAVDGKTVGTFRQSNGRESVLLRLPAWRAHDLSLVLGTYSRMMTLADQVRHVSVGEERLSSALHDASLAALGRERDEHRPSRTR